VALNFVVKLRLCFVSSFFADQEKKICHQWYHYQASQKFFNSFWCKMENMRSPQKKEISFLCLIAAFALPFPSLPTSFLDDIPFLSHICVRQDLSNQYCELKETNNVAW